MQAGNCSQRNSLVLSSLNEMILSDRTIKEEIKKGNIVIDPFDKSAVQPASVDLRLGHEFKLFMPSRRPFIDPTNHIDDYSSTENIIKKNDYLTIHPGQFILGATLERIEFANNIVARLDGRSSLGRLGVMIHATAGTVSPGWKGQLVLEISNLGTLPIALYPGMRVCQISFSYLTTPVDNAYGSKVLKSKYQNQMGAMGSRLSKEFRKKKK